MTDKLYSPSTARNRDPICDVFLAHMPARGKVLEIGAGAGEHAAYIAKRAPGLSWYTGDPDERARRSIAAWIADAGLPNLKGPHAINVTDTQWGVEADAPFDALVSINMIHIAPFEAARGLFAGASRLLAPAGALYLYGPFSRDGAHISDSNLAFDASLKARDPRWGVRDLEGEIDPLAQEFGMARERLVEMPANNFILIFRKA